MGSRDADRAPAGVGTDDRGQMVLLAGAVVAVALLGMLVAFLQLGYHADVASSATEDRSVADAESLLERATHDIGRDLRGEYTWGRREDAVDAAVDRLGPYRRTLERSRAGSGTVANATLNAAAAANWAGEACPGGAGRAFGPCVADDGVVVQERDGRVLVLAVAYDLRVSTDRWTAKLTVVPTTG